MVVTEFISVRARPVLTAADRVVAVADSVGRAVAVEDSLQWEQTQEEREDLAEHYMEQLNYRLCKVVRVAEAVRVAIAAAVAVAVQAEESFVFPVAELFSLVQAVQYFATEEMAELTEQETAVAVRAARAEQSGWALQRLQTTD